MGLVSHLKTKLTRFYTNQSGSVMVYVALAAIPVVGVVGVALDSARGYMVRSHLIESLDAAALAAGRSLNQEDIQTDVTRFFNLNFKQNYMGAVITGPTATYNEDNNTIKVEASAEIKTSFMNVLGKDKLTVSSSSTITRDTRGMELTLVMDNTGSMAHNGKIDTMKLAAKTLLNILYGEKDELDDFWISVVPYAASINIDNTNFDWLKNYNPTDYSSYQWMGCVEARDTPNDQNDVKPSHDPFNPYLWEKSDDNQWSKKKASTTTTSKGPNKACAQEIQPLTPYRSLVEASINKMSPVSGGGTIGSLGLVWGWRTISPNWRGIWQDTDVSLPLDYNTKQMDKVAIMLTDGVNQIVRSDVDGSHYTSYGRVGWGRLDGATNIYDAKDVINSRFSSICESMKDEGIIIYTITFQLNDTTTQNLYKNCATSNSHYFNSPSNEELEDAFIKIGSALSNLRISQ